MVSPVRAGKQLHSTRHRAWTNSLPASPSALQDPRQASSGPVIHAARPSPPSLTPHTTVNY
ncbi:hypothetical protein E2C01_050620 [Portunus trituberculatus]|uniref:Uncharacterized protein n=1 Tax=Portunus trituberculatus TaxID=210409 RepID=A0A5B7GGW0_PORTR|nr:hypothetical protein [Portunus trituberculatus]